MVSWGIQELCRGIGYHVSQKEKQHLERSSKVLEKKKKNPNRLLIETFSQNERGNLVDLVPGQQPALCLRAQYRKLSHWVREEPSPLLRKAVPEAMAPEMRQREAPT